MTDYQTAATEAAQFLTWLDKARKGAEALQHVATIEATVAERSTALKAQGARLDSLREQELAATARIEALTQTHDDLMQRTKDMQRQYTAAKAAIAKLVAG